MCKRHIQALFLLSEFFFSFTLVLWGIFSNKILRSCGLVFSL